MGQHLQQFARSRPHSPAHLRRRRRSCTTTLFEVVKAKTTNSLTPSPPVSSSKNLRWRRKYHSRHAEKQAGWNWVLGVRKGGIEKYTYKKSKRNWKTRPISCEFCVESYTIDPYFCFPWLFRRKLFTPLAPHSIKSAKFLYRIVRVKISTRLIKFYILFSFWNFVAVIDKMAHKTWLHLAAQTIWFSLAVDELVCSFFQLFEVVRMSLRKYPADWEFQRLHFSRSIQKSILISGSFPLPYRS